jgi:hypothetical protein
MGSEWTSAWWTRRYRVENDGVWEYDRSGECRAFITWGELQTVRCRELRSHQGNAIYLRLTGHTQRGFLRAVNTAWRERYPEAQRADNERALRSLRWSLRLLPPLLPALLCAACYTLYWWRGCPPAAAQEIAKVNRLALWTGLLTLACWLIDFFWLRRYSGRAACSGSSTCVL